MAMREAYPPLDSVEECAKCGQAFDNDTIPELHYGCKAANLASGEYQILDEWIRRTCPTCAFQWRENVIKPGVLK